MSSTEPTQSSAVSASSAPQQGIKRRREDDSHEDYKRQRPGYNPSGYFRLRKILTALGEPSKFDLEDSIAHAARVYNGEIVDSEVLEKLLAIIYCIITEQPLKSYILAVVLQVANGSNEVAGSSLVKFLSTKINELIAEGEWNSVKLVLRFIIFLKPMIENFDDVVIPFITKLADMSILTQDAISSRSALAEELYKVCVITLPYLLLVDGSEEMRQKVSSIFNKAKQFQRRSLKAEELLVPFVDSEAPYKVHDLIDLLNTQLTNLEENNWTFSLLLECSSSLPTEFNKHRLEDFIIPENPVIANPSAPELFLRFYINQQVETTPPVERIESTLIRDSLEDMISNLSFNRKEVARQLIGFDSYLKTGLLAPREMSLERLSQQKSGSTWKPEDIAIEAVLASLFKLPLPPFKLVYYHSVLIESCILAPHAIAPVFGRAIRFLYSQLEHLDVELIYRYIDWFAHHLSNFGYTWKWKEWSDDLSLNLYHPRRVFIQELINKELRLSFPQRIKESLPDEFTNLVHDIDDISPYPFTKEDSQFLEQGQAVLQNIRDRATVEEMEEVFESIKKRCEELGIDDYEYTIRDLYITGVVFLGARSLSHVESWIDRCLPVLRKICSESSDGARQTVGIVFNYWSEQSGTAVQIIKKLMNYDIITPLSVIEWIFFGSNISSLCKIYSWELLGLAIDRSKLQVKQAKEAASQAVVKEASEAENGDDSANGATIKTQEAVEELEESVNKIFVVIVRELSRPLSDDSSDEETLRWQRWWKEGFLRAILRHYHADYKMLQDRLKNLGLTDMFILNSIEQTSEL
ncbi:MIF4G like-domain-containing protein [Dipodascopsis uninucleata]